MQNLPLKLSKIVNIHCYLITFWKLVVSYFRPRTPYSQAAPAVRPLEELDNPPKKIMRALMIFLCKCNSCL